MIPCAMFAQSNLVGTAPENCSVLIEHFTGINVGEGVLGYDALIAQYTADPQRVSAICYHFGGFADPVGNQPDFRTAVGDTIGNYCSVQQVPRGVIGRRPFPNQFAIPYGDYGPAVNTTKNLPSPVNLGMASSWDAANRTLSVDVEIYYTADGTGGNDHISVALVENNVIAEQVDFFDPTGIDTAYAHPWLFREQLTTAWGDEVTNNSMGHNETRTYTLNNVSMDYDINNCVVVAYISEFQNDVYQAKHVPADGGTTQVGISENELDRVLGHAFPSPASDQLTIPFRNLSEDAFVRIMDATGRIVLQENVNKGSANMQLDVSSWSAGLYSYSLISESGQASATRIVQIQ